MDNLYLSPDVMQFVNILLNALIAMAALAITTYAGAAAWATIRAAWKLARGYVNDPNDKGIIWLSQQTGIPAETLSRLITGAGDALVNAAPSVPEQEHAEPGALGG